MDNRKNILVIDDDKAVRMVLCESCRELGFNVLEAEDGIQGMAVIAKHGFPDVIVTDIIMPQMGGLETIETIRKMNRDVRIIAISGGCRVGAEDFLDTAKKIGANMSFQKPINLDDLDEAIAV